jgi:hypothetical protein
MTQHVINPELPHLGGNFALGDPACFSASAFRYCLDNFDIKTVMDLGSGQGHTARWFLDRGCAVTAVEGLPENVHRAVVPTMQHDLVTGAYIHPVDLTICIEVVEHVPAEFVHNLVDTLANGRWILLTHAVPGQRGWHHVNCQPSQYWIDLLAQRGYLLLKEHSQKIRELARGDQAQHIARNGMLFEKTESHKDS